MSMCGLTTDDFLIALGDNQNHNFFQMQEMFTAMDQRLSAVESHLENVVTALEKFESSMDRVLAKDPSFVKALQATPSLPKSLKMNFQQVNFSPSTPAASVQPKHESDDSSEENFDAEPEKLSNEIFCYDCKKSFTRGCGDFTRHLKASLCKPYQCKCGKRFRKKSSLTTHKATHSKATLACYCGSIFRCEQYLKNHQRRVHGSVGNPDPNATRFVSSKRSSSPPVTIEKRLKAEVNDDSEFDPMNLLDLQLKDYEA